MTLLPRVREAGWFKTGEDGSPGTHIYADMHLFIRLEQDMSGSGQWTLELSDCRRGADGRVKRIYECESDARTAMQAIFALSRHLAPLLDRFRGKTELGRWELRSYDLSPADSRQLTRSASSRRE